MEGTKELTPREKCERESEKMAEMMSPEQARAILVEFCMSLGLHGMEEVFFLEPRERAALLVLTRYAAREP